MNIWKFQPPYKRRRYRNRRVRKDLPKKFIKIKKFKKEKIRIRRMMSTDKILYSNQLFTTKELRSTYPEPVTTHPKASNVTVTPPTRMQLLGWMVKKLTTKIFPFSNN